MREALTASVRHQSILTASMGYRNDARSVEAKGAGRLTRSSMSSNCASVRFSSSLDFGGKFVIEAYCEYVWKSASVCRQELVRMPQ